MCVCGRDVGTTHGGMMGDDLCYIPTPLLFVVACSVCPLTLATFDSRSFKRWASASTDDVCRLSLYILKCGNENGGKHDEDQNW